ncbi:hypothetical protein PHMEG_00015565 [Phytophthora megakarya]|uniref:Uncharacterized protein n=1 Tax=Phytophthora megakarya TaxID=4795 RepID=A0A225W1Z8_9STRA|nr:hypothetical protein PHMEG_00015565 [Phytophthora megakarya]
MPGTVSEYYSLLTSDILKAKMIQYVESSVTANVPLSSSSCPGCGNRTVSRVPYFQETFRKPKRQAIRPSTSQCVSCGQHFGSSELLEAQVLLAEGKLDASSLVFDENSLFKTITIPRPLPRPLSNTENSTKTVNNIMTTRAPLSYQHHLWCHTDHVLRQLSAHLMENHAGCFPEGNMRQKALDKRGSDQFQTKCWQRVKNSIHSACECYLQDQPRRKISHCWSRYAQYV